MHGHAGGRICRERLSSASPVIARLRLSPRCLSASSAMSMGPTAEMTASWGMTRSRRW